MYPDREIEVRERLTRLWLTAEPAVRAFVAASVRSFQDREDVVQQVALTVARRFEEYDSTRPFLGWVLWLAKSRIIDFHRTNGRKRAVPSEALLDRLAERIAERQETDSPRRVALDACLERLPDRSRRLIRLRYGDGLRIGAIAEAIGSTPGSVRVTLFRLRSALAECIDRRLSAEGAS